MYGKIAVTGNCNEVVFDGSQFHPMMHSTVAVEDEAIRAGLDQYKISNLSDSSPSEVFEKVLDLTHETSLVVAVGNLGGLGGTVASYFQHRGKSLGSSIGRPGPSN